MSRCLLGDRVRYDAQLKHYPELNQFIEQHFEYISVCPEVEIGLSVPRPAVQLYAIQNTIKILGRDNARIDITEKMQHYCTQHPPQLSSIQGYIFKSKSPSCGVHSVPLFNEQGETNQTTQGVFVSAMQKLYPSLPITDEQALEDNRLRSTFLQQVKQYQQNSIC